MMIIVSAILALWAVAAVALLVVGRSTHQPDVSRALSSNERIVSGLAWGEFDDVRATWAAEEKIAA